MGCGSSKAMEAQAKMEGWDGNGSMPVSKKGTVKPQDSDPAHVVALTSSTLRKYSPTDPGETDKGLNQWGDEKLKKSGVANGLGNKGEQVDLLETVVERMKEDVVIVDVDMSKSPAHHTRGSPIVGSATGSGAPLNWETLEPETIDVWELMEGIDDDEAAQGGQKTPRIMLDKENQVSSPSAVVGTPPVLVKNISAQDAKITDMDIIKSRLPKGLKEMEEHTKLSAGAQAPTAAAAGHHSDAETVSNITGTYATGDTMSPETSGSNHTTMRSRRSLEDIASIRGMLNSSLTPPKERPTRNLEEEAAALPQEDAPARGNRDSRASVGSVGSDSHSAGADSLNSETGPASAAKPATTKKMVRKTSRRASSGSEIKRRDPSSGAASTKSRASVCEGGAGRSSSGSFSGAGASQDLDLPPTPIFDPDLLATFEAAIQNISQEEWHSTNYEVDDVPLRAIEAPAGSQAGSRASSMDADAATKKLGPAKKLTRSKTPSPGRSRRSSKSDVQMKAETTGAEDLATAAGRERALRSGAGPPQRSRKVLEEAANANLGGLADQQAKKVGRVSAMVAALDDVVDKKEVVVTSRSKEGAGGVAASSARSGTPSRSRKLRGSVGSQDAVKDVAMVPSSQTKSSKSRGDSISNPVRYLGEFEEKLPPKGEGKVVLYTTTMRAVRKTFDECNAIRQMLQAYNVAFDERDISMHSEYREELRYLLGKPMPVPRLFIFGRYIGSGSEVLTMNEEGSFYGLLAGVASADHRLCSGCGNVRFVPCPECSGSRKVIIDDEVARCPDCNENGLIRCPLCE